MVRRKLGRTGLEVSPIAFGAFKIGRNQKVKYAQGYELPDERQVEMLLNGVLDLGINLIDTAPAYGLSEERIGRHIAHRRREYILSTKVGETFENGASVYDFGAEGITRSIHRSLMRLRTEVLDFVFIHSDGRDAHILDETDAVASLLRLKAAGLIRHIGLSGKTPQGAMASLAWADAIMIEFHPADLSHADVIAQAGAAGFAVLVKKPLGSGRLNPAEAIPVLLSNAQVSTLIIGGLNLDHIRDNCRVAASIGG